MPTGSQRDSREGKGRYDLLPARGLKRLSRLFEAGAKKYEARNWEKGQALSRYVDSGLRHTFNYLAGQKDEDHLVAAVWNLICCLDTEERIKDGLLPAKLDDLPGNPTGLREPTERPWFNAHNTPEPGPGLWEVPEGISGATRVLFIAPNGEVTLTGATTQPKPKDPSLSFLGPRFPFSRVWPSWEAFRNDYGPSEFRAFSEHPAYIIRSA